jgi:hypothetical protein
MKKYTFGGPKVKNWPLGPENGIRGPTSVWSYDISIHRSGILHGARKHILLVVKTAKISHQSPKSV